MSDEEIRDELITLLVAGHETTATSLAWALYWTHRFPEIKEKLLQELGTLEDVTDATGVMKLPYLNAVCQETLRIYPVAMLMLSRLVKSPLKIGGYEFQPGTLLVPSIYSIHHREDLYPNPKQFNPERFLDRQYAAHEYIPFGGGNRRCIGMAFAWFEMKLVLATLLSQWKLELTTEEFPKPERRRALLGMSESVKLLVKGKRSPSELLSENSNSVAAGS
jgi:cytochrome P450